MGSSEAEQSPGLQNRCNIPKWNRYGAMAWIVEDLEETLPESSQFAGCSTCSLEELKQLEDAIPGEFDTPVGAGSAHE